MAWFRKGRGRERLEVVHVELGQRGALLLGEVDEAVLARAAAASHKCLSINGLKSYF